MSDLANDLLFGAGQIAEDLFGADTKKTRRKVYHLHGLGRLPTSKLDKGPEIISRRSLLRDHFKAPTRKNKAHAATVTA
jgi:hypothetical protein